MSWGEVMDKKKHFYRMGNHSGGWDDLPADFGELDALIDSARKHIEPWLSAVFQAEHLNLLLGSGFTTAVGCIAGVGAAGMAKVTFGTKHDAAIDAHAQAGATAMKRGAANIEEPVKAIACWLNERGHRSGTGGRFGSGTVHKILTNSVYVGKWIFNKRSSKNLRAKPESEHVFVDVPAIIGREQFDIVAASLKSRNPRDVAPRMITGPVLLTGLAVCATCGGAMTLRTGTSKSGQVHKYYACSTCARKGKTACKGRSIQMKKLDALVTEHIVDRLLNSQRLTAILASLMARRGQRALQVDGRRAALQTDIADADERLRRLYEMVEEGLTNLDDVLKERLASLKLDRDRAKIALDRIKSPSACQPEIDPGAVERFGRMMRENVTSGEVPFRKGYIRSIVDRIEVDDEVIRIIGDKATLEQAVAGRAIGHTGVRSRVPNWRPGRESNP